MLHTSDASSFNDHLFYLHCSGSDWNTFYPDSSYSYYVDTGSNVVSYSGNTFVENAVFWNFVTDGCINIQASCSVLILKCVFENSNTQNSKGGGSIFQSGGQNIQSHVCSYKSSEPEYNGWGGHSYVETDDSTAMKSFVLDSTITLSSGYYNAVMMDYGTSLISSSNISRCNFQNNAAYGIDYIKNTSVVEYSSISNCTSGSLCIGIHIGNSGLVNSCIFIGNSVNDGGSVIRFDTDVSTCKNSIIQYNTVNNIFSGISYIINCNLSPNNCLNNNFASNDNKSLTLELDLVSTMNCQAEYIPSETTLVSSKRFLNTSGKTREQHIRYIVFLGFSCS